MDHSTEIGRKLEPAMSEFVRLLSDMTDQPNISRPISVSIKYDFIFRSADHAGLMQSTMPLMTEARQQRCIKLR
jgi:hypothetical protein